MATPNLQQSSVSEKDNSYTQNPKISFKYNNGSPKMHYLFIQSLIGQPPPKHL